MRSDDIVRILARDMSVVTSFELPGSAGCITTSEEFIYATETTGEGYIHCFTRAGTEVVKYTVPDKRIACPVLAPGGLLGHTRERSFCAPPVARSSQNSVGLDPSCF